MGSWSNDLEDTEATPVPTTSSEICSSLNKLLLDVNSKVLFRDCRSVVHSMHIEETHINMHILTPRSWTGNVAGIPS